MSEDLYREQLQTTVIALAIEVVGLGATNALLNEEALESRRRYESEKFDAEHYISQRKELQAELDELEAQLQQLQQQNERQAASLVRARTSLKQARTDLRRLRVDVKELEATIAFHEEQAEKQQAEEEGDEHE